MQNFIWHHDPFFLKEDLYMHVNCIQMEPATTEWFFKKVSSCLCLLIWSYLFNFTQDSQISPLFSKRNSHCHLACGQENSQNLPTSSTQAAQPNSLHHQLLIQLLSPPALIHLPLWGGKNLSTSSQAHSFSSTSASPSQLPIAGEWYHLPIPQPQLRHLCSLFSLILTSNWCQALLISLPSFLYVHPLLSVSIVTDSSFPTLTIVKIS